MPYADKEKQRKYCREYQREQRKLLRELREKGILEKLKQNATKPEEVKNA